MALINSVHALVVLCVAFLFVATVVIMQLEILTQTAPLCGSWSVTVAPPPPCGHAMAALPGTRSATGFWSAYIRPGVQSARSAHAASCLAVAVGALSLFRSFAKASRHAFAPPFNQHAVDNLCRPVPQHVALLALCANVIVMLVSHSRQHRVAPRVHARAGNISVILHSSLCFCRFYEAFWKDYVSPYGAFANYSKHPARQALSHTNQC